MNRETSAPRAHSWALILAALGIVFGDIGTSPLYALRESFLHAQVPLTEANILGILSLIFWTLILVICVKYVPVVMKADNRGEGGILSLLALVLKQPKAPRRRMFVLGLMGAALLYGDGVITPAISVLSAVEGLKILTPHLGGFVVPITLVLIVLLFLGQKHGTAKIGKVFGPIILFWFLCIGLLGLRQIFLYPAVLEALSPLLAFKFFYHQSSL
ncbi:MAG: KUP/HAK/KT family potassium transporter, partial [Bdellovibrio sp.]